jgi:hypothetical protein
VKSRDLTWIEPTSGNVFRRQGLPWNPAEASVGAACLCDSSRQLLGLVWGQVLQELVGVERGPAHVLDLLESIGCCLALLFFTLSRERTTLKLIEL